MLSQYQKDFAAQFDALQGGTKKPATPVSIAPQPAAQPTAQPTSSALTDGQLSPDGTMRYTAGPAGGWSSVTSTSSQNKSSVNDWYQNFAGRQGETDGINYWQGRLDSGEDYDTVLNAFKSAAVDPNNIATAAQNGYYNQGYTGQQNPATEIQGAGAFGFTPTGYTPASRANVRGYTPPAQAETTRYEAVNQEVTPDQTMAGQMSQLLANDSSYMAQARQMGLLNAHSRLGANSSVSSGAAMAEAVKAAAPIASQDAGTYSSAAANYANAQNRASEFGAQEENIAALQTNQQQDTANRFGAEAENLAEREYTQSENNASQFNTAAINRAGELYANAQNSASITNANNELSLALRQMQDDMSTYSTDIQRATALDNLGLNLFNTAINSGVFNNPESIAGYFNTVAGIFPDLGIQMVGQAASADPGVVI